MTFYPVPMPERIADVLWVRSLVPPRPQRTGDEMRRRRRAGRHALGLAVYRMMHVRGIEQRDARFVKKSRPDNKRPAEPPPYVVINKPVLVAEEQRVDMQRPSVGEFSISSLPENVHAHLYARTWDGKGFWRSRRGRRRNYKEFFRFNRFGVPTKVPDSDLPEGWTPLSPIVMKGPAPIHRPIVPNIPDIDADLEAFTERLMMALKTHLALPDEIRAMMRVRVYGLETVSESGDWPRGIDTRWRPSRAQREDSEVVLVWFALLSRDLQEICWLRAKGFSIRAIAEFPKFKKGKSHAANASKVRALYGAAVVECFRNSKSAEPGSVEGASSRARCA